jgi:hypothetical protein
LKEPTPEFVEKAIAEKPGGGEIDQLRYGKRDVGMG